MGSVVQLEDYKPHVMIQGLKDVHIIPQSVLEDVLDGKIKASELEGIDDFFPAIVYEWLCGKVE